jgi:hypothetical protein
LCSGGARQSRSARLQLHATEEAMLRHQTFLELDDIVTGYNIMGFDFHTSTAALRSCPVLAADLEGASARSARPQRRVRGAASAARRWATTTCRTSACPAASCSTHEPGSAGPQARQLLNTVANTLSATRRTTSPGDIFRLHAGDDDDAVVAKYCVKTAPSAACSARSCAP